MKTSFYKALYSGLFAGLLLATASTASAEAKKFAFQGTITDVSDFSFMLDSSVTNGAPLEGYYTIDTDVQDSSGDPSYAEYFFTGNQASFVVKFGNQVVRNSITNPNILLAVENRGSDTFLLLSFENIGAPVYLGSFLSWQLDDFTGNAFTNDALPTSPPDLSAFSISRLTFMDMFGLYFIGAEVTSIQEVPADPPTAPSATIEKAVQVKWTSVFGYMYQVQRRLKSDPATAPWTNIGEPVIGTGGEQSRFVSKGEIDYSFRVIPLN